MAASSASQSCLFCRIVQGEIPAAVVYRDEEIVAFNDINPQAPVHVLVIPRTHVASIAEARVDDGPVLGRLMLVAARLAEERGIAQDGYRLVVNNGPNAGQTVFHVHLHLIGGRSMAWPPG